MAEKKAKPKNSNSKLPKIYVGEEKVDIAKTVAKQIELLALPTPEKYIMQREGRGGLVLDYVETNYIIGRLNATFMFDWDTEILEQIINEKENQIAMKLRLVVRFANGKEIKKDAWGGSEIKRLKKDGSIMDLANDLKAAESDAIKKAASMLGIAWDVYSGLTKNGKRKAKNKQKEDHRDIADIASPPPEGIETFKNITITLTDGKPKRVTKYEALNYFAKVKEAIGEEAYYEILGNNGYEKSNQVPPKDIPRVYAEMIEAYHG